MRRRRMIVRFGGQGAPEPPGARKVDCHRSNSMTITVAHITPLVALLAGILILIMPRLLNFIVAIYLIIVGLVGSTASTTLSADGIFGRRAPGLHRRPGP